MGFVPSTEFWILFATCLGAGAAGALFWRRRRIPGGTYLSSLLFAVMFYALVASMEAAALATSYKIFWSTLEYIGSGSTVTLLLLFALQHASRMPSRRRSWLRLLWLLPVVGTAWAATNQWHHLVWQGFTPGTVGNNVLVYHHGPAFYGIVAGIYVYATVALAVLIRGIAQASAVRRRQAAAVVIAGIAPLVGGLLYVLQLPILHGINITPMSFALSGVTLAVSVVGLRHFDVASFARGAIFDIISDGILVLDETECISDINPAAKSMLDRANAQIGALAEAALPWWRDSIRDHAATDEIHTEVTIREHPLLHADVRITPLRPGPSAAGRVIVLRDISRRYEAERHLQQANEELQRRLQEIQTLQQTLRSQAVHDSLTGLFNRRYLEETVPRELASAARRGDDVALILLDIDYFKQLNDSAGHQAGDQILVELAQLLSEHTREGDIACRYGGDEFVLVLPGSNLAQAERRASELQTQFEEITERAFSRSTVSIGVATFPAHGENRDALLRIADRALYRAKDEGRNRVCTALPADEARHP